MSRTKRRGLAVMIGGLLWAIPAYGASAGVNAINVGGTQANSGSGGGLVGGLLGGVNAINVGGGQTNACGGVNAINVGLLGGGGQANDSCSAPSGGLLGGSLGGLNLINALGSQTNG